MQPVLEKLGITDVNDGVFDGEWRGGGAKIDKLSPIDGCRLASVRTASDDDYDKAITPAQERFLEMARHACAGARRNGPPPRQRLARIETRAGPARDARDGKDHRRRGRR